MVMAGNDDGGVGHELCDLAIIGHEDSDFVAKLYELFGQRGDDVRHAACLGPGGALRRYEDDMHRSILYAFGLGFKVIANCLPGSNRTAAWDSRVPRGDSLRGMGSKRKPKFGQNFLVDDNARHAIANALGDVSERTVIEIGPGHGAITSLLAPKVKRLIALELDRALAAELSFKFREQTQVEIVVGDVLESDFAALIPAGTTVDVIGNLPYYITSDILLKLFAAGAGWAAGTCGADDAARSGGQAFGFAGSEGLRAAVGNGADERFGRQLVYSASGGVHPPRRMFIQRCFGYTSRHGLRSCRSMRRGSMDFSSRCSRRSGRH